MAMVPHGRSLVQKLAGRPFEYLGVNCDKSKEEVKAIVAKHKIPWRSWFDGLDGPICKSYEIRAMPTIYILDQKGVIRFRGLRDKAMAQAVELLLAEAEANK
jgi:hypothetical protein